MIITGCQAAQSSSLAVLFRASDTRLVQLEAQAQESARVAVVGARRREAEGVEASEDQELVCNGSAARAALQRFWQMNG
jgi:hypothetical protein